MPLIPVKITRDDEFQAASVAFRRAFENPEKVDRSFQKLNLHDGIARDAESIGGEIAVAKYFGIKDFEPTCGTFKMHADVAYNIEVKHTKYESGCLILTERDRADDIAVLVVGRSPNYYIAGWGHIGTLRRPSRQRSDMAYWITMDDLHPIENLARSIYGNRKPQVPHL